MARQFLLAAALGLIAIAFAIEPAAAQVKARLSIATGGSRGVYYPLGGGLAALAAGLTGWLKTKTTPIERLLLIASGLVLVYPSLLEDLIGLGLFGLAVALQLGRSKGGVPQRI
jgi:TRAP-type uncharacterized transport system fused permease subunit